MSDTLADKIAILLRDLKSLDPSGQVRAIRTFVEHEIGLANSTHYMDLIDLNLVKNGAMIRLASGSFKDKILGETFAQNPDLHRTAAFFAASCDFLTSKKLLSREIGFKVKDQFSTLRTE
jgi:hypothetical protein